MSQALAENALARRTRPTVRRITHGIVLKSPPDRKGLAAPLAAALCHVFRVKSYPPPASPQTYWFPLCSSIRREGYSLQDAEDLTQEFVARLIEKQYLAEVDPAKGRFRSNQRDHDRAAKRGGHQRLIARPHRRPILSQRVTQLESEVAQPKSIFDKLYTDLGITR